MRSAEEIREHLITTADRMLRRPGMWGPGREFEGQAWSLLNLLLFIDRRENEQEEVRTWLHRFGNVGITGPLAALFGDRSRYTDEVASVFAELFARHGYLGGVTPHQQIDLPGVDLIRERYGQGDHRRSAVRAHLGEPGWIVGDVDCYVPQDPVAGWLFLDYDEHEPHVYDEAAGVPRGGPVPDPLLRDVRAPAATFRDGLTITPYGTTLRVPG